MPTSSGLLEVSPQGYGSTEAIFCMPALSFNNEASNNYQNGNKWPLDKDEIIHITGFKVNYSQGPPMQFSPELCLYHSVKNIDVNPTIYGLHATGFSSFPLLQLQPIEPP